MSTSKFLEFQDTDESGIIDQCDDLVKVPEQKVCPPCSKNPSFIAPDWKSKDVDEPWLNEKTCKFEITIVTNHTSLIPSVDATDEEAEEYVNGLFEEHEELAIDGILVYFQKENSDQNIDDLKSAIKYEKYDLDIRMGSKVKLLYSLPYEDVTSLLDSSDDDTQEEEEDATESGDITASYNAAELNSRMLKIRKALHLYGRYLNLYRQVDKGNLVFEDEGRIFYLKRYGDNGITGTGTLERVIKDIDSFLSKKGYRLRGGKISSIGGSPINEIEFVFTSKYVLKKISITTFECGDKQFHFGKKKIKSLTKKGHFKDKTAMGYLAQVDSMYDKLTAREPPEWTEFVETYTYPKVIATVNWPENRITETNSTDMTIQSCVGEALAEEFKTLGADILDFDFSLADALLYLFNKSVCKENINEVQQDAIKLNLVYDPRTKDKTKILELAKQQAFQQLQIDGSVFVSACRKLATNGDEKNSSINNIKDLFSIVFSRLKVCGMTEFALEASNCLMQQLPLEQVLNSVVKSALQNMSLENFGELFLNKIPPEDQQAIRALVERKLKSNDLFKDDSTNDRVSNYIQNGVDPGQITNLEPWTIKELIAKIKERPRQGAGGLGQPASGEQGLVARSVNNQTRTLAQRYDKDAPSNALQAESSVVMEVYVQALLEHYKEDLLSVVDILGNFPGAQLITKSLLLLDCPQPPLFEPSVADFIKDIELPFCRGIDDITFPVMRNPLEWLPEWKDITGQFPKIAKHALQQVLVSVLTRLMVKICEIIGTGMCKILGAGGNMAMAALGIGSDQDGVVDNRDTVKDLIKEAICGQDADDQKVEDTLTDIYEKLGLGATALADTEQLLNFAEDQSQYLSRQEIFDMYLGEASPEALDVMDALIEDAYPEYRDALPSKESIADFAKAIGDLMPASFKDSMRNFADDLDDDDPVPANPSLCATPELIEQFCESRAALLSSRATESQTAQMCRNIQDETREKLDELTNAIQQGPSDLVSNAIPQVISDPGCENGIVPFEPAVVSAGAVKSLNSIMKQIQLEYVQDMIGNGPGEKNWGLLNMILSDTMGNPLSAHNRKASNNPLYVSFVNSDGSILQKGQFPQYVAEWLQEELTSQASRIEYVGSNTIEELPDIYVSYETLGVRESKFFPLELPTLGWGTTYIMAPGGITFQQQARKASSDLSLSFADNNMGRGGTFQYGFSAQMYLSELRRSTLTDYSPGGFGRSVRGVDDTPLIMKTNMKSDNARIKITNFYNTSPTATPISIVANLFAGNDPDEDGSGNSKLSNFAAIFGLSGESIQEEILFEFLAVDDTININEMADYPTFQSSFQKENEHMPQIILLEEMLTQAEMKVPGLKDAETPLEAFSLPSIANELKTVHDLFMTYMSRTLISEVADNEAAFLYGAAYDDITQDDIQYVVVPDTTDSEGGTLYSEATIDGKKIKNADAILGISRMQYEIEYEGREGENRVFYLDPSEFGLSYVNPKIYIKPVANQGWLGLIDVLFPELSLCKDGKVDLINFSEIEQQIEETYNSIPMDERLQYNEDCATELPYNRILERQSAAGIQGIIHAACRIFGSTHFIKTLATFTTFKPDFDESYSNIYSQYIVENMEKSLKSSQGAGWERFNSFKDYEFWYSFLEQSVQTYGRLVDDGTISDPPDFVLRALFSINKMQETYKVPTREDWRIGRENIFESYEEFKQKSNFEAIQQTEGPAKRVLQEFVKMELISMAEKFVVNLQTVNMTPLYDNVYYYFLMNFTQGGIDLDIDKEIIATVATPTTADLGYTSNVANHIHSFQVDDAGNGWAYEAYHPTQPKIYHKHEIINWEVQEAQSECYPSCKDLYGLDGVGPHVHTIGKTTVPIGDIESYNYEGLDYEDPSRPFVVEKYISINGVKYGIEEGTEIIKANDLSLNISDVYPGTLELVYKSSEMQTAENSSTDARFLPEEGTEGEPIGVEGQLGVRNGLEFSIIVDGQKLAITSVEVDAMDYPIGLYIPPQANSKELLCLIKLLEEDEKFRLVTRYIFPINKVLSMIAIYNDLGFLPSIGEVTGDVGFPASVGMQASVDEFDNSVDLSNSKRGWASAYDRVPGPFSGWFVREWDNWDQELLRNSKSRLKKLFKTFYNSRDFDESFKMMFEFDPIQFSIQNLKDALRPRSLKSMLPRWRRGKMINANPLDTNNKVCKN